MNNENPIKLKGIKLFAAIHQELSSNIDQDEFSSCELLQAANLLIELDRKDFSEISHTEEKRRSGYLNYEVDLAFNDIQNSILKSERKFFEMDDKLSFYKLC